MTDSRGLSTGSGSFELFWLALSKPSLSNGKFFVLARRLVARLTYSYKHITESPFSQVNSIVVSTILRILLAFISIVFITTIWRIFARDGRSIRLIKSIYKLCITLSSAWLAKLSLKLSFCSTMSKKSGLLLGSTVLANSGVVQWCSFLFSGCP